jgi:hypothetical protein
MVAAMASALPAAGVLVLTCATGAAAATDPLDTWHARVSPGGTTVNRNAIASATDRFVVVGNKAGTVLTSEECPQHGSRLVGPT